jgi:hypothetical protein
MNFLKKRNLTPSTPQMTRNLRMMMRKKRTLKMKMTRMETVYVSKN